MAGYSQKELADETGINIKNIGFYENGNRDINGAVRQLALKLQ